jgi:hypothetical protein
MLRIRHRQAKERPVSGPLLKTADSAWPSACLAKALDRRRELLVLTGEIHQLFTLRFHHSTSFRLGIGDEFLVGKLALDLAMSLTNLVERLFEPRFSASRSMRSPSGRQAVASPTTICAEPRGASVSSRSRSPAQAA